MKKDKKGDIKFIPVKSANDFGKALESLKRTSIQEIKELQPVPKPLDDTNEFLRHTLQKGKYDIDYVISLLNILIQECNHHQLNRHDLPMSLRVSCQKLIANLQTEKLGKDFDPKILVTCPECKNGVVIPKRISHLWKCPCDKIQKLID